MSVNKVGLNSLEIDHIVTLLKDKLNFSRDLRAGDQFEVLQKAQFVDGVATGKAEIEAIKIINRNAPFLLIFTPMVNTMMLTQIAKRALFQRYPRAEAGVRVLNSTLNLHPVTGRISPHNGTDFV